MRRQEFGRAIWTRKKAILSSTPVASETGDLPEDIAQAELLVKQDILRLNEHVENEERLAIGQRLEHLTDMRAEAINRELVRIQQAVDDLERLQSTQLQEFGH